MGANMPRQSYCQITSAEKPASTKNEQPIAIKNDGGKVRWDLLIIDATEGQLRVLEYGSRKYARCGDCGARIYDNPRLDGDPNRDDCPKCSSTDICNADWNWANGFKWSRLIASALRHIAAFMRGVDTDDESGLPHIDHLQCCVAFLSAHAKRGIGQDDRRR